MSEHRIFTTEFANVYPLYIQKAERKNRTKDEVDTIILGTAVDRFKLQLSPCFFNRILLLIMLTFLVITLQTRLPFLD